MKYFFLFSVVLCGCAISAEPTPKPSGEMAMFSLLDASEINLANEPLCDMVSISNPKNPYTLKDHLAVVLSTSNKQSP